MNPDELAAVAARFAIALEAGAAGRGASPSPFPVLDGLVDVRILSDQIATALGVQRFEQILEVKLDALAQRLNLTPEEQDDQTDADR